jgi:tRNA A-37 threonylcarbamoyl transferase component Bud32/tetratricopeptide (TPR) repeat protein
MIGQTVSHYKIVRQLGAGGMGVVFAAQDPRLGREVALKFVPEELGHDAHALERLRSEARTASGLNHPNICTIYDIGEYEGRPFIVMELLRGQTLRERMTSRPLKVHETLDIGIQAADALYAAHSRDIIHRDIKPANLFIVESGQLKILDFGLAKLVPSALSSEMTVAPTIDLTAVGVALGTVAYMSPEQVTGESLDRRTDLFSLGVVLYEAATGQQPFKGKTSAVILASILTQTPVPPVSINSEIPIRLQEIINNCLEKDRELRYQDAASLRTDLKRLKRDLESGASGTVRTASILATGAVALPSPSGAAEALARPAADSQAAKALEAAAPASGSTATVSRRGPMLGVAAAAAVVIVAAGGFLMMRTPSVPPASPATEIARNDTLATTNRTAETAASRLVVEQAAASLLAGNYRAALSLADEALRSDAGNNEAARVRSEAAAAIARFDEAILNANKALAAGDTDAAARALNSARTVDPAAPVVATLSARILEQVSAQTDAARRAADAAARSAAPSSANAASARRPTPVPEPSRPPAAVPPAVATPPAAQAAAPPSSAPPQTQPAPQPTPSTSQLPAPPTPAPQAPPQEPPRTPPAARAEAPAERRPAPSTPGSAVEDDDAAIRRVVGSYARAIETKDIALFRSVKPNLSPMEQRRIEEGFRGVDQRVNVTILSIEHRSADAIVRVHRHDTIMARGRGQTADIEQTLTMTKAPQGWIIREIGR